MLIVSSAAAVLVDVWGRRGAGWCCVWAVLLGCVGAHAQERSVADIAAEVMPGVVWVGTDTSAGAGFVVRAPTTVVTALHVVERSGGEVQVRTRAGDVVSARVVTVDPKRDLAVLEVERALPGVRALRLRDAARGAVPVGARVVAIGHPSRPSATGESPLDALLEWVVSAGRVSASSAEAVVTDAALNPGNSGGPLVDEAGEVVGVVAFAVSERRGVAVAVGARYVAQVLDAPPRPMQPPQAAPGVWSARLGWGVGRLSGQERWTPQVVTGEARWSRPEGALWWGVEGLVAWTQGEGVWVSGEPGWQEASALRAVALGRVGVDVSAWLEPGASAWPLRVWVGAGAGYSARDEVRAELRLSDGGCVAGAPCAIEAERAERSARAFVPVAAAGVAVAAGRVELGGQARGALGDVAGVGGLVTVTWRLGSP